MSLPRQKLWKVDGSHGSLVSLPPETSIVTCDGLYQVRRSLIDGEDDYVVCSARPDIIWDLPLIQRVRDEIAAVNKIGLDWLCLSADGRTITGEDLVAAFFDKEPTLTPDRGRSCIVQASGTLYVFNIRKIRELNLASVPDADFKELADRLILLGYSRGTMSLQTDRFYPCFSGTRSLDYGDLDLVLASLGESVFETRDTVRPSEIFRVSRSEALRKWIEDAERTLVAQHKVSFVVRTIFRRSFLLRRCLISIDYLRRSLELPVEIVIATDVGNDVSEREMSDLVKEFPGLEIVLADGKSEKGYSRVRNLIAGIKATSGSRVCIIDDDDFYTPDAIVAFTAACKSSSERLVIFDTQIVNEKWTRNEGKIERELISYGARFDAEGWMFTLRGSNSIPLCGLIHPGDFVRTVVAEYKFDYDYSEDFVLHLMAFAHRKRPPVIIVPVLGAFQSHRVGDDNVSNVEDRTPWVVDVGNGIYQLLIERGFSFDAISGGEAFDGALHNRGRVDRLTSELNRTQTALSYATKKLAEATANLRKRARPLILPDQTIGDELANAEPLPPADTATSKDLRRPAPSKWIDRFRDARRETTNR